MDIFEKKGGGGQKSVMSYLNGPKKFEEFNCYIIYKSYKKVFIILIIVVV